MRTTLLVLYALVIGPMATRAQAAYDPPLSVSNLQADPGPASLGAIRCTLYADLVAWETDLDTPAPTLSLIRPTGPLPPCRAVPPPGRVVFKNNGTLVGRKGPFLLVATGEGTGIEAFSVLATSGRVLYTDYTATSPSGGDSSFPVTELDSGALRLQFTRAVSADCSLMQNSQACWAELIRKGEIPRVLAVPVPSAALCRASYQKDRAPADDPSIITYDVDMMLGSNGQKQVLSRGAIGCLPRP